VGLALVVVEEDARRAVELAHDDPLGAVDDEGAVFGHERDLAEVDLLLLDVPDDLLLARPVGVEDDEPHHDFQGRRIGQALGDALLDVVAALADLVAHELEGALPAEVADREDALEGPLETDAGALLGLHVLLQELLVGLHLDVDQVRDVDNLLDPTEILPEFTHHRFSILDKMDDPVRVSGLPPACRAGRTGNRRPAGRAGRALPSLIRGNP